MRTGKNIWLLTGLVLITLMCWSAAAFASWDVQQKYRNECGETAYDLTKVIEGEVTIDDAIHDRFNQHTWWHSGGDTYLKFYDGSVADGEETWACFDYSNGDEVNVKGAWWTDQNGNYLCDAGAPVGASATYGDPDAGGLVDVQIDVSNSYQLYGGGGITIIGSNVQYAVSTVRYSLENLNESLFSDPSLTWLPLTGFTLTFGQTEPYFLPNIPNNQYLIFGCQTEQPGGIAPTTEFFQIQIYQKEIPTLNQWGMIALLVLLLAAATVVIRRRVRTTA